MLWAIVGIGALIAIAIAACVMGACVLASRADDQMDQWLASHDEPRCDVTGQRLTAREQFERESG